MDFVETNQKNTHLIKQVRQDQLMLSVQSSPSFTFFHACLNPIWAEEYKAKQPSSCCPLSYICHVGSVRVNNPLQKRPWLELCSIIIWLPQSYYYCGSISARTITHFAPKFVVRPTQACCSLSVYYCKLLMSEMLTQQMEAGENVYLSNECIPTFLPLLCCVTSFWHFVDSGFILGLHFASQPAWMKSTCLRQD